jgi:hypothetical protein
MSIISSVIKVALVGAAMQSSIAFSQTAAAESVRLDNGYELTVQKNKLVEIDVHRRVRAIQVATPLSRLISSSSSVAFPVNHSKIIDDKEYVLVVVNQSSSNNPLGFCGAGEEGTLYVLNLKNIRADNRFDLPIQSCLKSISLSTDTGTKSPYSSIEWSDAPIGIKISWDYYQGIGAISRIYKFTNGKFSQ